MFPGVWPDPYGQGRHNVDVTDRCRSISLHHGMLFTPMLAHDLNGTWDKSTKRAFFA
jgi:hypothetical protein